ncbi:MAG: TonB family protein, partial [Pseudomonadota bacterium]|nr:TonB family protein [Pseudomonadota bacterium]
DSMVSVMASSASVEAMVAEWERPPETATAPVDTPPPPEVPQEAPPPRMAAPDLAVNQSAAVVLPGLTDQADVPAQIDLSVPPPPESEPEPEPIPEPEPEPEPAPEPEPEVIPEPVTQLDAEGRPESSRRPPPQVPENIDLPDRPEPAPEPAPRVAREPSAPSTASQGQKAAGTGGTNQAGTSGASSVKTMSKSQVTRAITVWGGQIRSRIERQKRFPRNVRASGRVVVRITVTPDGRVAGASIARSSGTAAFDQAALQAVSRSGRLPRAPQGLTDATYTFSLPMDFNR